MNYHERRRRGRRAPRRLRKVPVESAAEMTEQSTDEAEGKLGAWARQVTAIFEAMPEAVLLYDPSGNLVLPIEQWPVSRLMRGEVLTDEQAMEVLLRTVDGRQIKASFTGGPVRDQHGRVIGAVMTLRDLSERYRLGRELQEAEQLAREQASQLEAIFEAMPEALVVYDREGRTMRMNAAGQQFIERLRLSDYTSAPLPQRADQTVTLDEHGQPLAREAFPNARIQAGEILSPERAMEMELRDPQGETVSWSVTGGPLRDAQGQISGAVTVCRDITARKRAEQALRQQAEQLQEQAELIERAHDAILLRDADDRIVFWNRGAEQLYGWSAQEALGWITHELLQTHFTGSRAAAYTQLEAERDPHLRPGWTGVGSGAPGCVACAPPG